MSKLPFMQWFPGDDLKDPQLSLCSPATRGIWRDFLGAMHELDRRGQITGTPEQLARLGRCTAEEAASAIHELRDTKAADVTERNGVVTVINRRMKREYDKRVSTLRRVQKHRSHDPGNGDRNALVTGNMSEVIGQTTPKPPPSAAGALPGLAAEAAGAEGDGLNPVRAEVVSTWNRIDGVCHVDNLTPKRRSALNARLGEAFFREKWRVGMERVRKSEFCRGGPGGREWRASLGWFLKPDTLSRILEGEFGCHNGNNQHPAGPNPKVKVECQRLSAIIRERDYPGEEGHEKWRRLMNDKLYRDFKGDWEAMCGWLTAKAGPEPVGAKADG